MAAEFVAGGGEVEDANDAGLVDAGQTEELINQRHRAFLVIDPIDQIRHAIDHDEVDAAVLVVQAVHGLEDALEAVLALHADEGVGLEPVVEAPQARASSDALEVAV